MKEKVVYTVGDIAAIAGLSRQTIKRGFEGESRIAIIERRELVHKLPARYIPKSRSHLELETPRVRA